MINKDRFTEQSKLAIRGAFALASELFHGVVGSEHILWSLARDEKSAAAKALRDFGLDQALIREVIEKYDGSLGPSESRMLSLTPEANRIIELAEAQAKRLGHKKVEPEHMLLGMLQERGCVATKLITSTGAEPEWIISALLEELNKSWPLAESTGLEVKKTHTKTLDQYCSDLTGAAEAGKLDPVIGREEEIQRVVQILSRRTKNNPVLIGEPGVGKTAVAEGLAQRIAQLDVPENLREKRILSLDLTKMLAGTKFRGDFEERIKAAIEEATAACNVILFIDELHTLIGAGSAEGAMDAANILKPALGRGDIQVIGATTLNEYRKHVEKDVALERRFQPIIVGEPSHEQAVQILMGLRPRYEEHHKLRILDEAVTAAVEMSARYIQDRYLPDKAIDLVDEAASKVRTRGLTPPPYIKELEGRISALDAEKQEAVKSQDYERAALLRDRQKTLRAELREKRDDWTGRRSGSVAAEDIASVVSSWTGIPVTMLTEDESQRLLRLEETLHRRVIGQDEAVTAVSKAIRRGRVGLGDPMRPTGSFLFLGPTGVGKTELCKALAQAMFQDENAMIRVDMSEYMEKHTASKLIGSPPGYVGYDEGGQLTEKVRRKPYSVVLFDEIEKAHPDVWSILLQIMEDGRLTDAQGRSVDFKNAIIVMTSNLGAQEITDKRHALGFRPAGESNSELRPLAEIRESVMENLKKTFKPEFLNRIDDIVVFHQLDRDHIRTIARGMLDKLSARLLERGIRLEVADSAIDLLADKGFDPAYGARPLRRTIQSSIEDAAAERLLLGDFSEGDRMVVDGKDGEIRIKRHRPSKELVPLA